MLIWYSSGAGCLGVTSGELTDALIGAMAGVVIGVLGDALTGVLVVWVLGTPFPIVLFVIGLVIPFRTGELRLGSILSIVVEADVWLRFIDAPCN